MVLDEREQQGIEILGAGVPREVSVKVVLKPQLNKFKEKTSKKTLVIKKKESPKTITRKRWTDHEIEVMKKKIQCIEGYDFPLPELAKLFNRPYVSVHSKFTTLKEEFKKENKIQIGSCVENISNVEQNVFQGVVVEKIKSFAKVQIVIPSNIHKFGEILAFNTERLKNDQNNKL